MALETYRLDHLLQTHIKLLKSDRIYVQRSPLFCAPGLVKYVPAVARLFCLALPGSFLTMFAQNKGDLCTYIGSLKMASEITSDINNIVLEVTIGQIFQITLLILVVTQSILFLVAASEAKMDSEVASKWASEV